MKVVVLTTSYPRGADDVAGAFVSDAVEQLRAAGRRRRGRVARVVPALRDRVRRRHRRQPEAGAVEGRCCCPLFPFAFARAARRPPGTPIWCTPTGCPRASPGSPTASRSSSRSGGRTSSSRGVHAGSFGPCSAVPGSTLAASDALAAAARALGARDVRVVPSGVEIPERVGPADEPPHVALRRTSLGGEGRARAARGGARPAARRRRRRTAPRPRAAGASASSRRRKSAPISSGRPSSSCPSRREGYGVVARQAMAYGRPVVATAGRGPADAVSTARPGCSFSRATSMRCARRSSGCSPTRRCARGSATRPGCARASCTGSRRPPTGDTGCLHRALACTVGSARCRS